jgi:Histidine phosphatase superfamily (branch 1)
MRLLEVRRHARRERPAQHLVQQGVMMARSLGKKLGPFELVVSSPLARCIETAVAMGFAVHEECPGFAGTDLLGEAFPGIDSVNSEAGYAGFAQRLAQGVRSPTLPGARQKSCGLSYAACRIVDGR